MQTERSMNEGRTLIMQGREKVSLFGVEDVLRFDEEEVVCRTTLGELVLEGSSLRVTSFSLEEGTLALCGEITGLYYNDKKSKPKGGLSLWGR
ncbi:MAG: sporulation protein YabP [Ruminococcaceae bacterium]|nr:sporulation protein YabP [Oscillospiraceae bacterium]